MPEYNSDPVQNDLVKQAIRQMAGEGCTCEPDVQLIAEPDGTPGIHLLHAAECVLVLEWSIHH